MAYEEIISAGTLAVYYINSIENSRHTGLPGDTSGDDDELSTSQSLLDAAHQYAPIRVYSLILLETLDDRVGVDV